MNEQLENQDIPEDDGSEESVAEYVCEDCDTICYEVLYPSEIPNHCAYENALQQYKIMLNKLYMNLTNRDMLISELRDQHVKMQTYCRHCLLELKKLKVRYKTALEELQHLKRQYEIQKEQQGNYGATSNQELECLLKSEVQRWNEESMEIHSQMKTMNSEIQKLIKIVQNETNPPIENSPQNQLHPMEKLIASQTAVLKAMLSKLEDDVSAVKEMKRCPIAECGKSSDKLGTTVDNSVIDEEKIEKKNSQTQPEQSLLSENSEETEFISSPETSVSSVKEEGEKMAQQASDSEVAEVEENQQSLIDNEMEPTTIEPLNANKPSEPLNEVAPSEPFETPVTKKKCYCDNEYCRCSGDLVRNSNLDTVPIQIEEQNNSKGTDDIGTESFTPSTSKIKNESDTDKAEFSPNISKLNSTESVENESVERNDDQASSTEPKVTESKSSNLVKISQLPDCCKTVESVLSYQVNISQLPDCCKKNEVNDENIPPNSRESIPIQTEETNLTYANPKSPHVPSGQVSKKYSERSGNKEIVDATGDNKMVAESILPELLQNLPCFCPTPPKPIKELSDVPSSSNPTQAEKEPEHEKPTEVENESKNEKPTQFEKKTEFKRPTQVKKESEPEKLTQGKKEPENEKPAEVEKEPKHEKPTQGETEPVNEKPTEVKKEPENEKPAEVEKEQKYEKPTQGKKEPENEKPAEVEREQKHEKPSQGETQPDNEKPTEVKKEPENEKAFTLVNKDNVSKEGDNSMNEELDSSDEISTIDDDISLRAAKVKREDMTESEENISIEPAPIEEALPVKKFDPVQYMINEKKSNVSNKNEVSPANQSAVPAFLEKFLSTVTTEIENIKMILETRDELLNDLKGNIQNNRGSAYHENSELISKIQATLHDLPNWICAHSVFNDIQNRLSEVEQIIIKMQSIINELKIRFDSVEMNAKNENPTNGSMGTKHDTEIKILNELLNKMKTLETHACACSNLDKDEKQLKDQISTKCICKNKKKSNENTKTNENDKK